MDKREFNRVCEDNSQMRKLVEQLIEKVNELEATAPVVIDLGHNPTDGMKIPGLYDKITNSEKPVILTFSGYDPLGDEPSYFVNGQWMDVSFTAGGIQYSLCFGTMYTDIDDLRTPTVEKGIMVSDNSHIFFYEL